MTETMADDLSLEPERYEIQEEITDHWKAARCEFFEFVGEGGLVVVFVLDTIPAIGESGGRRNGPGLSVPQEIGTWLHVGETGRVVCYTGKVEVGQNIRTSLSQIIVSELGLPLGDISLVMADTDWCPFDAGTMGSRTTPITAPQVRKVASAAREVLFGLAAQKGMPLQGALPIPELLRGQTLFKVVGDDSVTKAPCEWQADVPVPKVNGRDFVTGAHQYTSDFVRPGMLYGKVLRAPSRHARRVSLDTNAAAALPGVVVVENGDFVGVVAPTPLGANRALQAIQAEWEAAPNAPNAHNVYEYFKQNQGNVPNYNGPAVHAEGEIEHGFAEANQMKATYTAAYIAHAPMEPRAAVAEWREGENGEDTLTVWTGTQRPFGVRTELADLFGISESRIRVIVPDTGSGYGGKHTGDAALEAARLSKAANRPVKVVWTREEEFAHAYFRPAGIVDIKSGIDENGMLTAWEFANTNSGSSQMRTLYRVPHQNIQFHAAPSPLRQGSYRALAATFNHFARETHMDELAHAARIDPLTFRLQNLDDARLRAVLQAAAQAFGWGEIAPPAGHGFGIAGGHEKGSYVATCAEVHVDPATGEVKVVRATTAFECGAIMNADNVRAQVDGAVIMGLGGALFEHIDFENGEVVSNCFSKYRVPRFSDIPQLETVLLDRHDLPSVGAGETPIVAIAPAIGNAIFHAVGVRLRSLPLAPDGVKA